jgi:hypothetical protein
MTIDATGDTPVIRRAAVGTPTQGGEAGSAAVREPAGAFDAFITCL